MAEVAKRLAFEDLSVTLNRLVDHGSASDIRSKLGDLVSSYDNHRKRSEVRMQDVKEQALKQVQSTGGRQLLKRQLQGLKSSLLNLGQKEFFAEALLNSSEHMDFKAEGERAAAALESSEEDLKDLKKENQQDEEHLQEAIRVIEQYQDQHQQVLARLALKLDMSARELTALEASRLPPPSPLPAAIKEEDLEALIAQQSQEAMSLESSLAQSEAMCRDMEGDVQANLTAMCHMEGEITRLKALREDEARLAEERHKSAQAWCDMVMSIVAQTTGVSLVSIAEDVVCLRLRQSVPEQQQAKGPGGPSPAFLEHTLTAQLQPGSSQLESAALAPATLALEGLVQFARETGGGLPLLLNMVRNLLYARMEGEKGTGCM